jgi:uncharacterized membrane protein YjfL (UPF0719 family)
MDWLAQHARPVGDSILYSLLGLAVLLGSFWLIERALPFSIRKELVEDQNTSLGIVLGAFVIAIAIIVSTAIK